ncbi:hypothetical protein Cni_G14915 [Canna indica]|uniref:Uncharacterized protein n=1 Tax=Canna indica TaxID=4628 RepID=A0AAQ3KCD3_9LILI|nr:hypothetical protein Cni_G14915 [Canna indica]
MNSPKVTAGLTWPPEMFAPTATATMRAKACPRAAAISPAGVVAPPPVRQLACDRKIRKRRGGVLKAMPEPWPAKKKIRVEINSASAALSTSVWVASPRVPMAIREIGISPSSS